MYTTDHTKNNHRFKFETIWHPSNDFFFFFDIVQNDWSTYVKDSYAYQIAIKTQLL